MLNKIIYLIQYKIKQYKLCPKCIGMQVIGNFGPCVECENFNKYEEYINYAM